jgi:hypothetical protein
MERQVTFWVGEREAVARLITEVEAKIARWERTEFQADVGPADKVAVGRMLPVLRASLDRARAHACYIDHQVEKQRQLDAGRTARKASFDAAATRWRSMGAK